MPQPRSHFYDFLAGVDPTGTKTFQYGMEDAGKGQASPVRRVVGTSGGVLGGAAVIPGAVGGLVGGTKGLLMGRGGLRGRLLGAAKGLLSGAKKPYTSLYRGIKARRALGAHQAGKKLTARQGEHIRRFVKEQLPESVSRAGNIHPRMVQQTLNQLSPKQLSKVHRELGGELGAGAAALGLSGAISGGSAYAQYGKGVTTGKAKKETPTPGLLRNKLK